MTLLCQYLNHLRVLIFFPQKQGLVKHVAQVVEVLQLSPLRTEEADEFLLLSDKAGLTPLLGDVYAAGLAQFAGLVEGNDGFTVIPAPEHIQAGKTRNLSSEAIVQD